jgi:hypothetical protein
LNQKKPPTASREMINIGTTMPTAMATTFGLEEEVSEEFEV